MPPITALRGRARRALMPWVLASGAIAAAAPGIATAQPLAQERTEAIASAWKSGDGELMRLQLAGNPAQLKASLNTLDAARRHFERIPPNHVLRVTGLAGVQTFRALQYLNLYQKAAKGDAYLAPFKASLTAAVDPVLPIVSYDPNRWAGLTKALPEMKRGALYIDVALGLLSSWQAQLEGKVNFGELAAFASLDQAYVRAAADLEGPDSPVSAPIDAAKRIAAERNVPLGVLAPRWVHVAAALATNERCESAVRVVQEPRALVRSALLASKHPQPKLANARAYAAMVIARCASLDAENLTHGGRPGEALARLGAAQTEIALARQELAARNVPPSATLRDGEAGVLASIGVTHLILGDPAQGSRDLSKSAMLAFNEQVAAVREAETEYRRYLAVRDWSESMPVRILLAVPFMHPGVSLPEGWNAALITKGVRAHVARLESQAIRSRASTEQLMASYRQTYSLLAGGRLLLEAGYGGAFYQRFLPRKRELDQAVRTALRSIPGDLGISIRAADLQRELRATDAVLDYVVYTPFAPEKLRFGGEPRYGAFVVRNGSGAIRAIDLGPKRTIDEAIRAYRSAYESQLLRDLDEEALVRHGEQIRKLLLDPLAAALSGVRRYYISPAGEIALVPFEALPLSSGQQAVRYLLEQLEIVMQSSPRDLSLWARAPKGQACGTPGQPRCEAILVGDPRFRRDPPAAAGKPAPRPNPGGGAERRRIWRDLPPLDETGRLVGSLAIDLGRAGARVRTLVGPDASEGELQQIRSPQLLMIASHGLFLFREVRSFSMEMRLKWDTAAGVNIVDTPVGKSESGSRPDLFGDYLYEQFDPFIFSMIALSGASDVPQFGKPFGRRSGTDDGMLTAYEAQMLPLQSTELVLLVGCQTAVGQASWQASSATDAPGFGQARGDTATGFRQAFEIAGARSVIGSLWDMPEQEATAYAKRLVVAWLAQGRSKYAAHREAQLEGLRAARAERRSGHPIWWAGMVFQGDPGDISR